MDRKIIRLINVLVIILTVSGSLSLSAQTRKGNSTAKKPAVSARTEPTSDSNGAKGTLPVKRNVRPEADEIKASQERLNQRPLSSAESLSEIAVVPTYRYEFTQPEFIISSLIIEHDASGKGKLLFVKKGYSEPVSDPIQISQITLGRINEALNALDFIASNQSYQFEKDFSHLGNVTFRLIKDDRTRETTFNWTQNKDAKALADEYRKVGNQFIWMFDILLARDNQPLESPKLLDSLESLIRRNEISDPVQMIPFLQTLVNDERVPLIARNHADKLVKQISKEKK